MARKQEIDLIHPFYPTDPVQISFEKHMVEVHGMVKPTQAVELHIDAHHWSIQTLWWSVHNGKYFSDFVQTRWEGWKAAYDYINSTLTR